jgi:hypothetical protein
MLCDWLYRSKLVKLSFTSELILYKIIFILSLLCLKICKWCPMVFQLQEYFTFWPKSYLSSSLLMVSLSKHSSCLTNCIISILLAVGYRTTSCVRNSWRFPQRGKWFSGKYSDSKQKREALMPSKVKRGEEQECQGHSIRRETCHRRNQFSGGLYLRAADYIMGNFPQCSSQKSPTLICNVSVMENLSLCQCGPVTKSSTLWEGQQMVSTSYFISWTCLTYTVSLLLLLTLAIPSSLFFANLKSIHMLVWK